MYEFEIEVAEEQSTEKQPTEGTEEKGSNSTIVGIDDGYFNTLLALTMGIFVS